MRYFQQVPQPAQGPQPVQPPQAAAVYVAGPSGQLTEQSVLGLRQKLEDLRNELQDAASRRRSVSEQLRSADGRSSPGLEARLKELDTRIVSLEQDITATGIQLRNAPPELLATTAPPGPREAMEFANNISSDIVPLVAIFSVFVLGPISVAIARLIWRRASNAPPRAAAVDAGTQQKLDQLQQAVDTIAIEVERISEGQRFVTRLMSDRSLGAGAAEPVRAAKKSAVQSERG